MIRAEIRPLSKFAYFSTDSLDNVIALLEEHRENARLLAGGTDLLVWMKKRVITPGILVDISKIPELSYVKMKGENLHIGSATTLNTVRESNVVREKAPLLAEAIGYIACFPIRNRATIGGNLCSASPAADTAPPLLALNASVLLVGHDGERQVPLTEFFLGPRKTIKKSNEVMKEIIIPSKNGRSAFLKLGRRKGFTLSIASVAAFAIINSGRFEEVKVAAGGLASKPFLSKKIEKELKKTRVSDKSINYASQIIKDEVKPHSVRASAAYRREMAGVLTKRVLKKISNLEE